MIRKVIISGILLMCLQRCKKEDFPPLNGGCPNLHQGDWFVEDEIREVEGVITTFVYYDSRTLYLLSLEKPQIRDLSICNMPENFKGSNEKVIVSGRIYSHPTLDYSHIPFELSAIRLATP